jgi:uroporphyrinogen decarboxylase
MINGMDRVVAAVNGEKSDRIPVFCNLFEQGAIELNMSIEDYYSRGENIAEAQLKLREKYQYDNVWSLSYVGQEVDALGKQKILFAEDGSPNIEEHIVKTYDDIEKLEVPDDLGSHEAFSEQLKCLQILKNEIGGQYPICVYITASLGLPILLMGMDKWFELLFSGPSKLRDLMIQKCHQYFVKEIDFYRKNGADCLVYSNPFGSTDTVSLKYFMDFCLPWIKKDFDAVGPDGLVYYCGMSRFNKVIEPLLEQIPIQTFYLSPLDSVSEGKKAVNGRALTCGVVNDIKLVNMSNDEIVTHVKSLIDAGKPGGKFLLGASALPYEISETKIRTMLDTAYEYGSY